MTSKSVSGVVHARLLLSLRKSHSLSFSYKFSGAEEIAFREAGGRAGEERREGGRGGRK